MLGLNLSKLKYLNSMCFYVTIPPAPQINHGTMKCFDGGKSSSWVFLCFVMLKINDIYLFVLSH